MSYVKDADKKTRVLMAALIDQSNDCCGSGKCRDCLMDMTDGNCGSIRLRALLEQIVFRRD